jgi:hypothetical protein
LETPAATVFMTHPWLTLPQVVPSLGICCRGFLLAALAGGLFADFNFFVSRAVGQIKGHREHFLHVTRSAAGHGPV